MENKNSQIDIEKIMQEIREDITKRNLCDEMPDFFKMVDDEVVAEFDMTDFNATLISLNHEYEVEAFPAIAGNKINRTVKKGIRHFVSFQTAPAVAAQNVVNMDEVSLFNQIGAYIVKNEKRIQELEQEVAELKKMLEEKK